MENHLNNVIVSANIAIKIPMMTMADENDSKSTRDTVFLTIDNGMVATDADLEPAAANPEKATAGGHVKYVIDINHGDDTWQTAKRYREFEALHKNLLKDGIRPDAAVRITFFFQYHIATLTVFSTSHVVAIEIICQCTGSSSRIC